MFLASQSLVLLGCAAIAVIGCYICSMNIYIDRRSEAKKRAFLIIGIILSLADFCLYIKVATLGRFSAMMLGVIILSGISYLTDIYKGDVRPCRFEVFAAYCLFFGKLVYAPLVKSKDFIPFFNRREASPDIMGLGVYNLFAGLFELLLPAKILSSVGGYLSGVPDVDKSLIIVALVTLITALKWYFVLSGYSKVSRGIGMLFLMDLPRNHSYPFGAGNFAAFYNRFLITQNEFARSYIAPSLGGGEQVGSGNIFSVAAVSAFSGLWFGYPGGVIFGLLFGVIIWLERHFLKTKTGGFRSFAVFTTGILSFILLVPQGGGYFTELSSIFSDILHLPSYSELGFYMLLYFSPVIIVSLILSTRIFQRITAYLESRSPVLYNGIIIVTGAFLMIASMSSMIQSGGWL